MGSLNPTIPSFRPTWRHAVLRHALSLLFVLLVGLSGFTPRADASDGAIGSDGAVGVNTAWEVETSPVWYIELQRQGADLVRVGTQKKNAALIQSGLDVMDWGFSHEAADGSYPGTAGGSTGQMFHSTAIFVEAAARATNQLKAYDPTTYADVISRYTAHLQTTCDWLLQPDVAAAGQLYNTRFTHRRYMLAAALSQVAELVSDPAEADKFNGAAAGLCPRRHCPDDACRFPCRHHAQPGLVNAPSVSSDTRSGQPAPDERRVCQRHARYQRVGC